MAVKIMANYVRPDCHSPYNIIFMGFMVEFIKTVTKMNDE